MMGDWFRNNGVPTLLIELNSLLESGEEEVSPGEILIDFLGDSVFEFELFGARIIPVEFEIGSVYFAKG